LSRDKVARQNRALKSQVCAAKCIIQHFDQRVANFATSA